MPFSFCFRSVRFRLTFWYALTLAVILAASGAYWYRSFARDQWEHIDKQLLLVAEDLVTFHLFEGEELSNPDHCQRLETVSRKHNWKQYVQFLNEQGNITCATSNQPSQYLPFTAEALRAVREKQPYFETIKVQNDGDVLRILTYPITVQERLVEIVQIAEPLDVHYRVLRQQRVLVGISSTLLLFLLTAGSWFVSGRALAPVVQITSAVRRISAENLSQRLPVNPCPDELADLQTTFNSVLDRLEEAFNRVRQFTADVSHELRTPLAILKGETEVALRWGKDSDELRDTLESNLEEIDRLGRIIEDLLTLAKSEAGQIPLVLNNVNLNDLMQSLYLIGKALGETKSIEFNLRMDFEGELYLVGDQLQLHRMLLNLISNAVKYTPEGGRVEVQLAVFDDNVRICVIDNGIGIAPEHLPHLFDRFYRVNDVRNRDVEGSGLGLSIVRWIVRAHGGDIQVVSEPNRGSVFTVVLPLSGLPDNRRRT
ncbi:MAG: heavy metal sensor histidine kinase [Desulfuromonadaceae bacterium]